MPSTPILYEPSCETIEPDEPDTQKGMVETLTSISDTTFKDSGEALRSVHAKCQGLLRGEMHVLEGLPETLRQGLFAEPGTYPVVIRFSTSPGDVLDDRISTPRGFAMKVIGVQGERLPGASEAHTQDFLLVNGPAFLAPTPKKFLGNLKMLAGTTDKIPHLKLAFSAVARGAEKLLEAVGSESGTLKGLGGHPETHLLGETFYSQVPFLFGPYMAKWSVAPVSPELLALKDAPLDLKDHPNGVRDAVVDHFAGLDAQWELRVQLCTDLKDMPIEDASVPWPEDKSPFIAVARIHAPSQLAWDDDKSPELQEGLSFSPWHGLAAHRPLGGVNRARRSAYSELSALRSPRGRCPIHEPTQERAAE